MVARFLQGARAFSAGTAIFVLRGDEDFSPLLEAHLVPYKRMVARAAAVYYGLVVNDQAT